MREREFRGWLERNGARTDKGRAVRLHAVRTIERHLADLGCPHEGLDAAYADDRFAALKARLGDLRQDAMRGGEAYRLLMPQSEKPAPRLASWRGWLGQYGRFLEAPDGPGADDRFDAGMEKLRQTFLERMPGFERMSRREGPFWEAEQAHKAKAQGDCLRIAQDATISDENGGRQICKRLSQGASMPLNWRTVAAIDAAAPALQSRFYAVMGQLARTAVTGEEGEEDPLVAAAEALETLRDEGLEMLKRGEMLALLISLYGTFRPDEACWFKIMLFQKLAEQLLGRKLFRAAGFEAEEIHAFQALLRRIADRLEAWGWEPGSLFDVQGFVWVALGETGPSDISDADRIRQHVLESSIRPAQERDEAMVEIHVGAVNEALGLHQAWPNICQALSGRKFQAMTGLAAPETIGVAQSSTTRLRFSLKPQAAPSAFPPREAPMPPVTPTNLILYGPPGTGKTHETAAEAVRLCTGETIADRDALMAQYRRLSDEGRIEFVTFHQSYSYEDFVEGLRPVQGGDGREGAKPGFSLEPVAGVFRRIAQRAEASDTAAPFVIIIDEINRANISKVFGELIALIEADKRLAMPNALRVRLPYSRAIFGVPANLHIIGTMNTADRSIALLDTALRRRFEFRELMPRADLLGPVEGIDCARLLRTINTRIEYLFDREHQIGHAYLIGCRDKADLDAVMRHRIIPLLTEYFHEDWHKVALVLGDGEGRGGFLRREALPAPPGLETAMDLGERWRWSVADDFPSDAYARLAAA